MVISILFAVLWLLLLVTAERIVSGESLHIKEGKFTPFAGVSVERLIYFILAAAVVGFINYCLKTGLLIDLTHNWISIAFFAISILIWTNIVWWWLCEGCCNLKELIVFTVMIVVLYFSTRAAAFATAKLISNNFWASVICVVPLIMVWVTPIAFLVTYLLNPVVNKD